MANKRLPRIITQPEFEKLFEATKNKEYKLAMLLGFEAGMRISEIIGFANAGSRCCDAPLTYLKVTDRGYFKRKPFACGKCGQTLKYKDIYRNIKFGYKIEPLNKSNIDLNRHSITIIGKGNKQRIVPLPKRFNTSALAMLPIKASRRALQWHVTKLGKTILQKGISFHTLRHGFASYLINKGRPLNEIQMFMGHSRLDVTGIYLHADPQNAVNKARDVF